MKKPTKREIERRVNKIDRALVGYAEYAASGREVVRDALTDLMHLCDAWGIDFDAELDTARFHHSNEAIPGKRKRVRRTK